MTPQKDMKARATSGIAWTAIEKFAQQALQFAIGIVIARILSPQEYGIIGMTAIFFAVANTFVESGFGSALIQKKDRNEADYSTCFYFNIAVSLALYALLWAAAPYIATFYRTPVLSDVIRGLGISLVINSASIAQTTKLTAEMRFKEMAKVTMATQVVTGAAGIVLAYRGYGVWALVFQQVSGSAVKLLLIEVCTRWRPALVFSRSSFRHMFSYGSKILCSSLINTVYDNLYTLVIGRMFAAKDVGFYNRGNQFATLPTSTLLSVFMKVAFPLMAEVQDDTEKLRKAYKKFIRTPLFILYPTLCCLIALADPLICSLLGDKWQPAAPLLQVLCLGAFFDPLTHINLNVLYVKGRTDLVLKLELIKKPIAFIILFASLPLGLFWLCFGRSVYGLVAYCFNCHYTKKFIDFGFWQQIWYNVPVLLKSVIAGLASYAASSIPTTPISQLLAGASAGALTFIALAVTTHDETWEDIKQVAKERIKGKQL